MIVPLDQASDETRFGGKAAQLCAALRLGLPVPSGFALDHTAVGAFLDGHTGHRSEVARLFSICTHPVAARSSAVGEDSGAASFAGQHKTVLGISTEDALLEAIRVVWNSGRDEAARAYRSRLGLEPDAKMGVVVQHLVRADVAGVLFTRHPVTGADERVIEASWGLGESVVSGIVTPDNYRLLRGGKLVSQTLGEKDVMFRWSESGGTEECPVSDHLSSTFCLTPSMLAELDALASRCESLFPGAHDIEFAFEGSALYLLQRRAITRD